MTGANLPSQMDAWTVEGLGEPTEVMRRARRPVPLPEAGQVLIEVWMAALSLVDGVRVRSGLMGQPLALPFTPGHQVCGEIVAVGDGVPRTRLGERVIATISLPHGSLARYTLAGVASVLPAPTALDDASAAVFGVPYQTAWLALYRRAGLKVRQSLVVYGATGDVGAAAVQLGKAAGAHVVGVVSGPHQARVAYDLGADVVVDRSDLRDATDAAEVIRTAAGRGADVVLVPGEPQGLTADDTGGLVSIPPGEIAQVVGFEGLVVITAPSASDAAEGLDALSGGYGVLGVDRDRYLVADPSVIARAHEQLTSLAAASVVRPLIADRVSFDDAPKALADLVDGRAVGPIAVRAPI